jgi:hypothetical protein
MREHERSSSADDQGGCGHERYGMRPVEGERNFSDTPRFLGSFAQSCEQQPQESCGA